MKVTVARPSQEKKVAQILLALDAATHDLSAVEAAVALAARLQAELIGLFIEDADLLRIAQLPFSREILTSARERALSSGEMERSLRSLAAQMQRLLAREAERAEVKWAFRTVRGRRVESVFAESGPTDLLILARSRRVVWHPPPEAHTIYLLYDASEEAQHGVAVAHRLAAGNHTDVVLIDTGTADKALPAREAALRLRELGIHVTVRTLTGEMLDTLPKLFKEHPAALFLVPAGCEPCKDPKTLSRLQERLECPVIVVR